MSNIDKQALRDIAAAAESAPLWHAVGVFGEVVDPANPVWKPVHDFFKTFTAERVLALLDELEAVDALNKHLELAIRKAEGCSEKLREKAEAAEKRIAELTDDCWIYEGTVKKLLERAEAAESACSEDARILESGERMALTRSVEILRAAAAGKGEAS
ncbi:TPA: ead/Ea22-like family protein [Klebsiella pneumoniae]